MVTLPMIRTDFDPVAYLQSKGYSANQETSPTHGFSGEFTPEVWFGHWTASAKGSDTSSSAVRNRHYQSCTNRSGHTRMGGYRVRQAHGGYGRAAPMDITRSGRMNASIAQHWINSRAGDDSSLSNRYGMSSCIDCTIDENVSQKAVDAWLANGAMWLAQSGLHSGYAMLHSISTDRKIDVNYLIVEGVRRNVDWMYLRLQQLIDQFKNVAPAPAPEAPRIKMYAVAQHPTSDGYAIVKPDGGVYNFKSPFYGSAAGSIVDGEQATDMAWTPSGKGYWVLSSGGRIYSFGDARYRGGCLDPGVLPPGAKLVGAATELAPTRTGNGYRISCDDGGLFCFGDASYYGNILEADKA